TASEQNGRIRALSPLPPGGGAGGEGPGLSDCSETTYGPESSRPLPNPLPSWERELVKRGRLFRGGQRTVPFLRELPSSAASASKQNSRIRALSPLPLGRGAGGEGRGFSDCSETTYGPDSSRPLPNSLPTEGWETDRHGRRFGGHRGAVPSRPAA